MEKPYDYGYKIDEVRGFLEQYCHQVSHLVVMHTDVKPSHSFTNRLSEQTLDKVSQRLRWFNNRFTQRLYGKKIAKPLIIPTIEGVDDIGDKHLTCHINLCVGNLPVWLKSDEQQLRDIIESCWLSSGGMNIYSNRKIHKLLDKHLFVQPITSSDDASRWVNYITKEGLASWDVINTILPTKTHC